MTDEYKMEEARIRGFTWGFGSMATVLIVAVTNAFLFGCPSYNVYSRQKDGEAQLAEALASKQVAVQTAKAKWESASYEAKAEIVRAGGVAQANKIIGDSLRDNEAYLRYLYVNNMEHTQNQVIYIPTEAGMPILEAGQRPRREPAK